AAGEGPDGSRRRSGRLDACPVVAGLDPRRLVDEGIEDGPGPADGPRCPRQRVHHGHEHDEGRDPDQQPHGPRRLEDPPDDGRPQAQEPEHAGEEEEAEQAPEASPWPPSAGRPRLVLRPPRRSLAAGRPRPARAARAAPPPSVSSRPPPAIGGPSVTRARWVAGPAPDVVLRVVAHGRSSAK